jgi:hypothetical protein
MVNLAQEGHSWRPPRELLEVNSELKLGVLEEAVADKEDSVPD